MQILISTGAVLTIEEVNFREENGKFIRQALFNRTNHRNLPVIYIGNRCFTFEELDKYHKRWPRELEDMLRDAGAITGFSKSRAVAEATGGDDTAQKFTRIANTF